MLPSIQRFSDFTEENLKLLVDYVHQNPFRDYVYTVVDGMIPNLSLSDDSYLKGSVALLLLMERLPSGIKKFTSNDIDIVFLDRPWKVERKDNIEYVSLPFRDIPETFAADDLPTCRVAIDNKGTYWVSVQCIVSVCANVCYLPEYIQSREELHRRYSEYAPDKVALKYSEKIAGRIQKYIGRGFIYTYKQIDYNLDFIRLSSLSK